MSEQEGAAPLLPPRRRHWRKDETEHASLVQSFAGLKGLVYGTVLGGLGCYFAGIAYPKFGQQRLQVKVFLTASVAMAWFTFSADKALLRHETEERDFDIRLRSLARTELGRQGIIATEHEINKWKDGLRQEFYSRTQPTAPPESPPESSSASRPQSQS